MFFFEFAENDGWDDLRGDPNVLFDIDVKAGGYRVQTGGWPSLSAGKIYKIFDAFVEAWPPVPLPGSYGSSEPPGNGHTDF